MRLPPNLALLVDVPLDGGPQTERRLIAVQIGDPAWGWRRALVRVAPAGCDAERFRAAAARLRGVVHPCVTQTLHVEAEGEPYAILEYGGVRTLATLLAALAATGARIARAHADVISDAIDAGLGALHAAGLAHGDLRAERVSISTLGEVQLALGVPWDERATADRDLRAARDLRARLRGFAIDRPPTAGLAAFLDEVCGPAPDPFRGAYPPRAP